MMQDIKNVEVELRGPLSEEDYARLLSVCEQRGELAGRENRFFLDYSTFIEGIEDRKLDVRVRITNGNVELIVKKGDFGGAARLETALPIQGSDLVPAVRLMGMLGYRKAVACDRGISRYVVDGVELALQDVRSYGQRGDIHSRFFEAEILCLPGEERVAEERIRVFLQALNLSVFTKNDWINYVRLMNAEANGVFDLDNDDVAVLAHVGQRDA